MSQTNSLSRVQNSEHLVVWSFVMCLRQSNACALKNYFCLTTLLFKSIWSICFFYNVGLYDFRSNDVKEINSITVSTETLPMRVKSILEFCVMSPRYELNMQSMVWNWKRWFLSFHSLFITTDKRLISIILGREKEFDVKAVRLCSSLGRLMFALNAARQQYHWPQEVCRCRSLFANSLAISFSLWKNRALAVSVSLLPGDTIFRLSGKMM